MPARGQCGQQHDRGRTAPAVFHLRWAGGWVGAPEPLQHLRSTLSCAGKAKLDNILSNGVCVCICVRICVCVLFVCCCLCTGHIQALKLVVQKDRRFAFVNFASLEEAQLAKRELSKLSLWRSNVSYAKRETIAISSRQSGAGSGGRRDEKNWSRSRSLGPSRFLCLRGLHNGRQGLCACVPVCSCIVRVCPVLSCIVLYMFLCAVSAVCAMSVPFPMKFPCFGSEGQLCGCLCAVEKTS